MAILRNPGGTGRAAPTVKRPPSNPPVIRPAVTRRAAAPPRPAPAPRPVAPPRPPPVIVPNRTGNFSRPKPPPRVAPGPVQQNKPQPRPQPRPQPVRNQPRPQPRTPQPIQPRTSIPGVTSIRRPTPAPQQVAAPQQVGTPAPGFAPPTAPQEIAAPAPVLDVAPELSELEQYYGLQQPSEVAPAPVLEDPEAPPPPPGVEQYLAGDTDYLGAKGNAHGELARFLGGQNSTRSNNANSFAQRLRDLQKSQKDDEGDLQEDFASRGLARSGSYADALGGLQQQYLGSQTNLQGEQAGIEGDLATQLADFQAQQQLALQNAQAEAIARRAAQYGLG